MGDYDSDVARDLLREIAALRATNAALSNSSTDATLAEREKADAEGAYRAMMVEQQRQINRLTSENGLLARRLGELGAENVELRRRLRLSEQRPPPAPQQPREPHHHHHRHDRHARHHDNASPSPSRHHRPPPPPTSELPAAATADRPLAAAALLRAPGAGSDVGPSFFAGDHDGGLMSASGSAVTTRSAMTSSSYGSSANGDDGGGGDGAAPPPDAAAVVATTSVPTHDGRAAAMWPVRIPGSDSWEWATAEGLIGGAVI